MLELLMRIELTTFPVTTGMLYRKSSSLHRLSNYELLMRIELTTSSLPRKCSTPELQQLVKNLEKYSHCTTTAFSASGRRGSNPRPTAWKAVALPTELLPHMYYFQKINSKE